MTVPDTSKKNRAGPKVRKLQSTVPCAALSGWTCEPCKFTAKPGHRFCGQHLKVIDNWNERLSIEAVLIPREDSENQPAPVVGFLSGFEVEEDTIFMCWMPASVLKPKMPGGRNGLLGFSSIREEVRDFAWLQLCRASPERIAPLLIKTRLPQGIEEK